jgi:hypothetical protein
LPASPAARRPRGGRGVYFYNLETEGYFRTRRMTMVK